MLWAMAILLFALWALGLVSGAPLGASVHLLLLFAVVALALAALQSAGASRGARPREGVRR